MGQFLPGTDFVTSGYSVMPRHDNTFGGGNYDADDLDEWLTIQRDWQVDGGIEPVGEDEVPRVRDRRRSRCRPSSPSSAAAGDRRRGGGGDDRLRRGRHARPRPGSRRVSEAARRYARRHARPRPRADVEAPTPRSSAVSGLDVALALDRRGFDDVARAIVDMQRQRVSADYLQTSAVIDAEGARPLRRQRPEPLRRPGHGLPPRGSALGDAAGAPARGRRGAARDAGGARRRRSSTPVGEARRRHRPGRGRDRRRARLRGRDPRDDQRARPRRRARGGARRGRGGRRDAAARPRPPRRRRRLRRARRRPPLRLGGRARDPVEGDGRHPPRRPAAARQPRALRDVAAVLARELSRDGPQRGRAMRSASASGRFRPSSTTSRARS